MYEEFYGFKRLPFQLLPDPDFFYRSEKHETALTHLEYGVFERAGFILITGEIGTGKTTLLRYLLRSLDKSLPVALLTQTYLSPEDLLRALCQEFSLPHRDKDKPELLESFGEFLVEQYRKGHYTTLILDEAQNLPAATLEEIRMLSNLDADSERLLQIILSGQPPLRTKLQRKELRQLYQRVEVSYHLKPLDRQETIGYIRHRLNIAGGSDPEIFEDSAADAIFEYSGGVPRLINAVCHACLVYAFADGQNKITRDLVETVLKDRENWGLYPKAESLAIGESADSRPESQDKPDAGLSRDRTASKLDRLVEISESSMRTLEGVTSELARMTSDTRVTALKEELTREKKVRASLEERLAQAEATVSRLERTVSKIVHEDPDPPGERTNSAFVTPKPSPAPVPKDMPRPHDRTKAVQTAQQPTPRENVAGRMRQALVGTLNRLGGEWLSADNGTKPHKPPIRSRRPPLRYLLIGIILCLAVGLAWWATRDTEPTQPPVALSHRQKVPVPEKPLEPTKPGEPAPGAQSSTASRPTDTATVTHQVSTGQTSPSPAQSDSPQNPAAIARSPSAQVRTFPEKPASDLPLPVTETKPETFVCVVRLGNVRSSPNLSAPVLDRITRDEQVRVVDKAGDWLQVQLEGGTSGWAHQSLLRPLNSQN